jgi:DNA polymerase elongation subunit (family B)
MNNSVLLDNFFEKQKELKQQLKKNRNNYRKMHKLTMLRGKHKKDVKQQIITEMNQNKFLINSQYGLLK